ncbi:MAG: type III pantothenate kinase [Bacteriovorax sp.]
MRLITVDNGNTNPHVGIYQDDLLLSVIPLKDYSPLKEDFIIVSDVGAPLSFGPSFDLKTKRHTKENPNFFDMPVHYSETLGDDRLILGYFLFKNVKKADEKILAIDAGTFITMDIITPEGFQGGYIFPGLNTFLAAYAKGSRLPVLPERKVAINELPHSTEEAILGAADYYLDAILEKVIKKTSPSKIVITGGSLDVIKNKIDKLNLKVQLETGPHLIHSALYLIYQNHLRLKAP